MRKAYLLLIAILLSCCLCGCHNSISNDEVETTSYVEDTFESEKTTSVQETVDCKELLKDWFEEGNQPSLDEIVTLNESKYTGDYKLTLCEMLRNNLGVYFLVKLETKDGSKLKTGDISKAPENYRGALTDIEINYLMTEKFEEAKINSNSLYCYKIPVKNDYVAYYVIEGFFKLNSNYVSNNSSKILLEINSLILYEPYVGVAATKETVLTKEYVMFEIEKNVEQSNKHYLFVSDDGETAYLFSNGFFINYDKEIYNNVRWEMEYDNKIITGDYDDSYFVSGKKDLYLKWTGKYLDIDRVGKITVNGKEFCRAKE